MKNDEKENSNLASDKNKNKKLKYATNILKEYI